MKRKIISVLILLFILVLLLRFSISESYIENIETIVETTKQHTRYETAIFNMQNEMIEIKTIKDKKEWFILYKNILDKYSYILDYKKTIYDYFTEEEIYLIQRVVETECYDQDFVSKCNVASVILNRYESKELSFGDTIDEIITNKNQFAYGRKIISEDTILAVEYAFSIEDTTGGCIAFRSDDKPDTWYDWGYQFTDDAEHHFYKEVDDE